MNQGDSINTIVSLATGMVVVMGIGYFIRQAMIPGKIPDKIAKAPDIMHKTPKEIWESGMTIEDMIYSIWKAEYQMRKEGLM